MTFALASLASAALPLRPDSFMRWLGRSASAPIGAKPCRHNSCDEPEQMRLLHGITWPSGQRIAH
jgi:hypothetical protein